MALFSKLSSHIKVYLRWVKSMITVSLVGSYLYSAIIRKLIYNLTGNSISRSALFSPYCFGGVVDCLLETECSLIEKIF